MEGFGVIVGGDGHEKVVDGSGVIAELSTYAAAAYVNIAVGRHHCHCIVHILRSQAEIVLLDCHSGQTCQCFRTTAIIGTQAVVVGFCLGIFAKLVFAVGFLVESHERGRVEGKSFCEVAQGLGRLFKHLIYFSTEKMALEKHIGIAFGRMERRSHHRVDPSAAGAQHGIGRHHRL